ELDAVEVRDGLWRISTLRGTLLGHIAVTADEPDTKYVATRMLGRTPRRVPMGTYWSLDDAIQCFVRI
ncbi:hypothetical protein, partial [Agrococcus casei]